MELSNKILNSLLSTEQIDSLQVVFDYFKSEYLKNLDADPFRYDFTDDEVKDALKTYLEGDLGGSVDTYDLDNLYNIIKDEFI